MKAAIRVAAVFVGVGTGCNAAEFQFEAPVRVMADGEAVRVERPGYASPCWADIDDDGYKDLLVGQFNGGKIHVYKNLGNGDASELQLAARQWVEADGAVAEVPGVW